MAANGTNGYRLPILKNNTAFIKYKWLTMAIWQYCVDQFNLSKRKGSRGIQVVLPNFTALPLPEFNLLWKDRIDREYLENPTKKGAKTQNYIYIEIDLYWKDNQNKENNFCVQMKKSLFQVFLK